MKIRHRPFPDIPSAPSYSGWWGATLTFKVEAIVIGFEERTTGNHRVVTFKFLVM